MISCRDLTRKIYFFESTLSPNVIWVRMEALDFGAEAPVKRLEVNGPGDLVGECSGGFKPSKPFTVLKPEIK